MRILGNRTKQRPVNGRRHLAFGIVFMILRVAAFLPFVSTITYAEATNNTATNFSVLNTAVRMIGGETKSVRDFTRIHGEFRARHESGIIIQAYVSKRQRVEGAYETIQTGAGRSVSKPLYELVDVLGPDVLNPFSRPLALDYRHFGATDFVRRHFGSSANFTPASTEKK
jgi:hypothetical protein